MQIACDYTAIPTVLRDYDQWVAWQVTDRQGRPTKVPINPHNGKLAQTDDPTTWASLAEAVSFARRRGIGLGFVFSATDPFAGVDLDDCVDPATGAIAEWAAFVLWHLDSYAEVSPSGRGVKIICRGTLPPGRRGWGGHGLYDQGRFFTITGQRLAQYPGEVQERGEQLQHLHRLLFPPSPTPPAPAAPVRDLVLGSVALSDDEVLARSSAASNGGKFRALWAGDVSGYGSQSEADAALVALLRFWVGPDEARIDRLFRQSGLCRGKWEERGDYRRRTLALVGDGAVYTPHEAPSREAQLVTAIVPRQQRQWGPQLSRLVPS